jgi:putative sigma-54 modulation protein
LNLDMRLVLRGHHVDITPALRRLVGAELAKLERVLNNSAVSAQAILTLEKYRHRADITLHARGEKFLHGVATTDNWAESVTRAVTQIAQQAQKVKNKHQDRKRHALKTGVVAASENAGPETAAVKPPRPARAPRERVRMPRILRASRQTIKAMSVADAARQVEADGDGVVVFRDVETEAISVMYRGRDGQLALVETEA